MKKHSREMLYYWAKENGIRGYEQYDPVDNERRRQKAIKQYNENSRRRMENSYNDKKSRR